MTRPHEEISNGDKAIAVVTASAIVAVVFYLAGGSIHFLFYAGLWLFLSWLSLVALLSGKRTAAAQNAQIDMNQRQKTSPPPGGSKQPSPATAEKQEATEGTANRSQRGDVPKVPPPSDNWPT